MVVSKLQDILAIIEWGGMRVEDFEPVREFEVCTI
jgi:hypothetical protein